MCVKSWNHFAPICLDLPQFCPLINNSQAIYGCQSIGLVSISTYQQRKVTTRLLLLIHPQFPRLIQSRPTPYCLPWPSSTIWDCILCTSPFSPLVCASQPPFLDIHPTPLHPQTAPTVRKKTERNSFKHVGINLPSSAPFSPFPPDGLHYFIPQCANARDRAETEDFFPLSMKRIAKSSAIQHHRLSHQHEHWIHMLQQKLLARELTHFGPQRRGESQF